VSALADSLSYPALDSAEVPVEAVPALQVHLQPVQVPAVPFAPVAAVSAVGAEPVEALARPEAAPASEPVG
jgi:hypothetical protein